MLERKTKARLRVNKLTLPLQGNIAYCTAGMCFLGRKKFVSSRGSKWGMVRGQMG